MQDFGSVLYEILGDRIKERREDLGFSQTQLSERVSKTYKLGRSSISNIEQGRQQPPLHVIYEICQALNLDVQSLLPTYSEILGKVELTKSTRPKIEKLIKDFDIDAVTLEQIKKLINKER